MKSKTIIKRMAFLTVLMLFSLTACKKTEETVSTELATETETDVQTEETKEIRETENTVPEGMMRSYLTGELVSTEIGMRRPFAIMINNVEKALPQSGIGQASILYEAIVEGDITRMLAVFEDVSELEKVGPIRSARHNYIDFAMDNEAIFVHYGWSIFAENKINELGLETLNGLSSYEKTVFYRATDRQAPHNVYSSGEMLNAGVNELEIESAVADDYEGRLSFYEEDTVPETGAIANNVSIPFSSSANLVYDSESGEYAKFEFGAEHLDAQTGEQLYFKNILIQFVDYSTISSEGHQDMALNGSGKAILITNGKAVDITWERESDADHTKYYNADGTPAQFNIGKSYFAIVPTDFEITMTE